MIRCPHKTLWMIAVDEANDPCQRWTLGRRNGYLRVPSLEASEELPHMRTFCTYIPSNHQ